MSLYVQIGCGHVAPEPWANFDASLRARLPLWRGELPRNVRYGDATRIPLPSGSAVCVFASHVYEHLPRQDVPRALAEAYRLLAPRGKLRLIVPDLRYRAALYLRQLEEGLETANDEFMKNTELGVYSMPGSLVRRFRRAMGHSRHQWMWDEPSMRRLLAEARFKRIRRCSLGDSGDPMLALVEREDRFISPRLRAFELAMEAER